MKKLKRVLSDRTTATLLLSAVFAVIMGNLRPGKPLGIYPKQYWATKVRWESCADAVVTGDSRTLMAVSPEELQKVLSYKQIKNYGFGANWYCRQYLEAVERLLLPQADKKAVILGITPHSLTGRRNVMGNFIELNRMSKQDAFLDVHFGALVNFFEPMSFRDAVHKLIPSLAPTRTQKDYRANGWVAIHKEPLVLDEVKRFRRLFKERHLSDDVINNVMEFVKKWTSEGIKVYGFIVPSCRRMVEVEQELSGFEYESFVADFTASGGIWLEVDLYGYESFDGPHLQDVAAKKFSSDLARLIYEGESRPAGSIVKNVRKVDQETDNSVKEGKL